MKVPRIVFTDNRKGKSQSHEATATIGVSSTLTELELTGYGSTQDEAFEELMTKLCDFASVINSVIERNSMNLQE